MTFGSGASRICGKMKPVMCVCMCVRESGSLLNYW